MKDKLFNFRPVFFTAIALCAGIVFGYLRKNYGVSLWWLLCLLPLGMPFFFCRTRVELLKTGIAVSLLLSFFAAGCFAFTAQIRGYEDCGSYDGEVIVVGRVAEKQRYEDYVRLTFDDLYIDGNKENGKLDAYLSAAFCENVELSDEVLLRGHVKTETALFNEYGFRASEIGDSIKFRLTAAQDLVITGHKLDLFAAVRTRMQDVVYAGMDETPAAVTMAVLTGETAGIEQDLLENVRRGGIAHIFAVSGLHVGALYAFCLLLFKKTALRLLPKPWRFVLLAALLLFYAGVCGFSPSVVRATVLCLISYAALLLGVSADGLETLGVAGIFILLITPTALFEVGFQLSFSACLGILLLRRPIGQVCDEICFRVRKLFPERKLTPSEAVALAEQGSLPPSIPERIRRAIVSFLAVTFSAQIATAPILFNAFGYLSGWSLLLNCVFVPVISAAFAFLLLLVVIACILPIEASGVILFLPNGVWSALLLVFETVDFSTFSLVGEKLSGGACAAYYAGCCFLSDKWNISKPMQKALIAACFVVFAVTVVALNAFGG